MCCWNAGCWNQHLPQGLSGGNIIFKAISRHRFFTGSPQKALSLHYYIQTRPYNNIPPAGCTSPWHNIVIQTHIFQWGLMEFSRYALEHTNPTMRKRQREDGEGWWWTEEPGRDLRNSWVQFMSVRLCHHGNGVSVWGGSRVVKGQQEACLSCYCCCYRSCMGMGRSWVGSRTCPVPWDSMWWCRHLSAVVELGKSWTFHLAAGCSCSVSAITQQIKEELWEEEDRITKLSTAECRALEK